MTANESSGSQTQEKIAEIVLIEDNPGDVLLFELALQANHIPYHLTRFKTGEDARTALCRPEGTPRTGFSSGCYPPRFKYAQK